VNVLGHTPDVSSVSSVAQIVSGQDICNIFSTIHICACLLRPSGLIGTIT